MKGWTLIVALVAMNLFLPAALANSPAGSWTTIDDKTGKKRAVIHLSITDGKLVGSILKVYPQPGDANICSLCPGEFKDKPITGLQLIWGLEDKGQGRWEGGQILDPQTGKIYRAKMTLEGNKLYVRGFIGMSAFGRTQVWAR